MATVQVNGSSVTVTSTKNRGGVAIKAGTSTTLTNRSVKAADVGVYGSVVVDGTDTNKALNAGVFSYSNSRPVAKRLSSSLATVSNKTLLSGAAVPGLQTDINRLESVITNKTSTAFRAGNFNLFTGKYSSVTTATDSFGNDTEARVTRTAPGRLVYKLGKAPVRTGYKSKTT
jgi:hypothetical protein